MAQKPSFENNEAEQKPPSRYTLSLPLNVHTTGHIWLDYLGFSGHPKGQRFLA
jgi:hypothetical protein